MTKLSHFDDWYGALRNLIAVGVQKPRFTLVSLRAIQTVQTGLQTGLQTVVKCIQAIQTVKDNQFLQIDLLYRVFTSLYGLYAFHNSL